MACQHIDLARVPPDNRGMRNATPDIQDSTTRTLRERVATTAHNTRVRMNSVRAEYLVDASEERLNEGVENVREALHNGVDFITHITTLGVTKGADLTRRGVALFNRK